MVSLEFLYFFLPVFMGIYAVAGVRLRKTVFLIACAALCAWRSPWCILPMAACTVVSYVCGRLINRFESKAALKRLWLVLALTMDTAVLLVFIRNGSYDITSLFTGKGAVLKLIPVWGAGVFTLHGISYCIDIFRGDIEPEKNFLLLAQYVCFFPCFSCGPILRYNDICSQLRKPLVTSDKLAYGIKLLLVGYAEKLFLSDSMYEIWQHISEVSADSLSTACAWLGMIAFSFAFYYELRAYSHIAIGLGSMLGFELPENFDLPFMSAGFNEFIKRFACTLYSWVRDYFYLPLCRNKRDGVCLWALLLSVLAASLWYGFGRHTMLWAVFVCLMLGVEYLLKKILAAVPMWIRCAVMNFFFLIGLPFLSIGDISAACGYVAAMFGGGSFAGDVLALYVIKTGAVMFLICGFFATGISRAIKHKITQLNTNIVYIVEPMLTIGFLLLCTAFLVGGGGHSDMNLFMR